MIANELGRNVWEQCRYAMLISRQTHGIAPKDFGQIDLWKWAGPQIDDVLEIPGEMCPGMTEWAAAFGAAGVGRVPSWVLIGGGMVVAVTSRQIEESVAERLEGD
jgi:hypothetical protein